MASNRRVTKSWLWHRIFTFCLKHLECWFVGIPTFKVHSFAALWAWFINLHRLCCSCVCRQLGICISSSRTWRKREKFSSWCVSFNYFLAPQLGKSRTEARKYQLIPRKCNRNGKYIFLSMNKNFVFTRQNPTQRVCCSCSSGMDFFATAVVCLSRW